MSTTMKSAVHLGRENQQNLIACRNTNFEELFDLTLRLIVENSFKILNTSSPVFDLSFWMRSTLCHDQVIMWAKAKVHVYSDSVLCLGKLHDHPEANEKWRDQVSEFQRLNEYEILRQIQNEMKTRQVNLKQFEGRIHVDVQRR